MNKSCNSILFKDNDGYLTHMELHTASRLFLPMGFQDDDDSLEDLIIKMDVKDDGKIAVPEFVQFIKETGSPICNFALV